MLQVSIPLWALVHLPVVVTVTTAIFTPKGWLHCILYVLFENAMGIVKMGAVIAGEQVWGLACHSRPVALVGAEMTAPGSQQGVANSWPAESTAPTRRTTLSSSFSHPVGHASSTLLSSTLLQHTAVACCLFAQA